MKERIEIIVPEEELELVNEKEDRFAKTYKFEPTDRVPVAIYPSQWTCLAARKKKPADLLRSPIDNLREQILNEKWRLENIRDDRPIPTESLTFVPDLGCLRGVEFDMKIEWSQDQPPKCEHIIEKPEQIDTLDVPDPAFGLNAKYIQWHKVMSAAVEDFDVRLNGTPLTINVTLDHAGGPIPAAFALAGGNLFLWMSTEPQRVHRLMKIVTVSHIQCVRFFDELMGRDPKHPVGMGCDAGEMIGPEMYREFVVPYYLQVWSEFEGTRGFHNCGPNEHLLDIIRDELRIDVHDGFGFCVRPEILAEKMSGRVVLTGGPNPMLIKKGPRESIITECARYIQVLGRRGGYILTDGYSTAPGTPTDNLNAMVEASRQIECPIVNQ